MTSLRAVTKRLLSPLICCAMIVGAAGAADEDVGVSTSPLELAPGGKSQGGASAQRLQGEFVVRNQTSLNIAYQVQWGSKGAWKEYTLHSNELRRHWHKLDANGRAPSPYLRFDSRADDKKVTWKTYDMDFGKVGRTNSGAAINQALKYHFVANGKAVDLRKQ